MNINSNPKNQKIVLFGGAFSPFHIGHLKICQVALEVLNPDFFYIIPYKSATNQKKLIASHHRIYLIDLQIKKLIKKYHKSKIIISDYELNKNSYSFSYLTCQYFRSLYPDDIIYFLLGTDCLNQFWRWKSPNKILDCCHLVHLKRENEVINQENLNNLFKVSNYKNHKQLSGNLIHLKGNIPKISSSIIKKQLKQQIESGLKKSKNKNLSLGLDLKALKYLLNYYQDLY